jgi:DegV family protein with EDD domain
MAGVRIVTDSACDLPQELVDRHGIGIVPLTIRFGDEELVDRIDLSASDFYKRMAASSELPQTAAPSPGAFEEMFTRMADDGADAVVCIDLSAALSATMSSAQNAATALEGKVDVRVLDSRSITAGLGTQVVLAAEAAAEGRSADDIVSLVEDLSRRTRVIGALDTLENLKKGGRIGGAQALLGTMLSIKPLVDISTGEVKEAGKQRTRRKAMVWLRDTLAEQGTVERLCICHGDAPDLAEFKSVLAEKIDITDVPETFIGATIGTHGGPRILGLSWLDPA